MRIGFVISDISLGRGGERVTITLANALCTEHEVTIVSLYRSNKQPFFPLSRKIRQIHIHEGTIAKNKRDKFVKKIVEFRDLIGLIRKSEIDIWIGVGTYCSVYLGLLRLLKKSSKFLAWEHSNYDAAELKWQYIRRFTYSKLNGIICLNNSDGKAYTEKFKSVYVIPNMISFRTEKKADLDSQRILSIGALESEKGFDLLLYAFSKSTIKDYYSLRIVGSGSRLKELQELVLSLKLKNVEILPPNKDVLNEYLHSSVYVLPSRREGFGMVLIEAMECGLPCIAFDCPSGPGNIIKHEFNGLLVESENTEKLSEAMARLIQDRGLAERLASNGKEKVNDYSEQSVLLFWQKLFNELIT